MTHVDAPPNRTPRPEETPAGLASELLLEAGLKPVVRELHDAPRLDEAAARWEAMGYAVVVGDRVREDPATAAMVTDRDTFHTIRPLRKHPVIERLLALGGPPARLVLTHPSSPIYRRLCARWGADQAPIESARPDASRARERVTLYVSREEQAAQRARDLDRMAADDVDCHDPVELGRLLGYPGCCIDAFASLERRWPNRMPIEAASRRSERFLPRLNNVALDRFAWIAWFPCSYDCEPSARLADAAADVLDARSPGLVDALDGLLCMPRVWRDDQHQAVLIGARRDGPETIRFDNLVPLAEAWPPTGDSAHRPRDEDPWDDLRDADTVRLTADGAVFLAGRRELHTDDHPLVLPFGLA